MTYDCYWQNLPNVLNVKIQLAGTAAPADTSFVTLGVFTHPGPADELGYSGSHVLYQHLAEMLYRKGRTDMYNLRAELDLSAPPAVISVTGVTVTPATLTLAPGGTRQLAIVVAPDDADNKSVTCTSSNPNVADVTNTGLIAALLPGTADITVTTVDGGFTQITKLTVKVAVTGVTIQEGEFSEMNEWGTKQLHAVIAPTTATNKEVTWTSSKTDIATVDAFGNIAALAKAGDTVITATSKDAPTKKATHTLTVNTLVSNISTRPNDQGGTVPVALGNGADMEVLIDFFAPDAKNRSVTAESSDPTVMTVSAVTLGASGQPSKLTVHGAAAGEATLQIVYPTDPTKNVNTKFVVA